MKPLKVLVACESSGVVRDSFNRLGHVATSCDLLDTETPGRHIVGDALDLLKNSWDLIIAHPPCTYLTVSAEWAYKDPDFDRYPRVGYHQKVKTETLVGAARREARERAVEFFRAFLESDCPKVAVENPVGYISRAIRPADQYIQPHQFGHNASKKTGLWLKGLPNLSPTRDMPPRLVGGKPRWANQTDSGQNNCTHEGVYAPGVERWSTRSKTYQGIADAMALQWGGDTGWREVSFAADCDGYDEETGELGDICSICGLDYCEECACPGPTQEGYEYEEFHGVLMARYDFEI